MNKKILLSIVIMLIASSQVQSQNECDKYVQRVDSLIKVDALDISRKDKPERVCENVLLDYTKEKGYIDDENRSDILDILKYPVQGRQVENFLNNYYNGKC